MSGMKCVVFVVLLDFLSRARGDAEVSCVFMESCILPCSFQAGQGLALDWIKVTMRSIPVHSYYKNKDQLDYQDLGFKNRTSLFKDQISGGNASLQLTGLKIQDQGSYVCSTNTLRGYQESSVHLKVEALVRKVEIQKEGNRITCSSQGIYPEPHIIWTTNPPSTLTLQNKTTVHQTEQQLYNINSSLIVSDTNLDYICTVSTCRNTGTATLFKSSATIVALTAALVVCQIWLGAMFIYQVHKIYIYERLRQNQTSEENGTNPQEVTIPLTTSDEENNQTKGHRAGPSARKQVEEVEATQ